MRYRANAKVFDGTNELGRVTYIVKAKNKAEAKRKVTRMLKAQQPKHKKNVEMGFWRGGSFHPTRTSSDYDKVNGGDYKSARSKRAKATTRRAVLAAARRRK